MKKQFKHCRKCRNEYNKEEKYKKVSLTNKGKEYNKSRLGVKESEESKLKRSQALKGRVGGFANKKHKTETKLKQREKRLKDIDDKYPYGWAAVNYNKKACILFEKINQAMGWNGQHAENGGECRVFGYFLDYYNHDLNIVIEYDEKRHEIPKQKVKDEEKQMLITNKLGCKFYRIKQGDENDFDKIIEDLKNILK